MPWGVSWMLSTVVWICASTLSCHRNLCPIWALLFFVDFFFNDSYFLIYFLTCCKVFKYVLVLILRFFCSVYLPFSLILRQGVLFPKPLIWLRLCIFECIFSSHFPPRLALVFGYAQHDLLRLHLKISGALLYFQTRRQKNMYVWHNKNA